MILKALYYDVLVKGEIVQATVENWTTKARLDTVLGGGQLKGVKV